MNNYSINHLAISRTRPATGRPDLVDGIDDLEAETIWGRDHYSIGKGNHPQVTETVAEGLTIQRSCFCVHDRHPECGRWQFCAGLRVCHYCAEF